MIPKVQHGSILGGVVTTPDMTAALVDYRDRLGMVVVDDGPVGKDLAEGWNAPAIADARIVTLQPHSGAQSYIRLVEQPDHPDFKPTTSFGWAAYELTVKDVHGWPERLAGSGFTVVGPPREIPSLPYFVPMQVIGRGGEMLYLNEIRSNTPSTDLPMAISLTDHIFIVILATDNMQQTLQYYCDTLQLDAGETHEINYTMINKAFDLADGTQHKLAMVQQQRMPIIEVDAYPACATKRPGHAGMLPPGNALVTLAMDDLDALQLPWISAPEKRDGPLYQGRRSGTFIGPAGALLELIEIAGTSQVP